MPNIRCSYKIKFFFSLVGIFLLFISPNCWAAGSPSPSPDLPGNIFISQNVGDFKAFKKEFQKLHSNFKDNGFSAYSLHRDLKNPSFLILTLKCSNLKNGIDFIHSTAYRSATKKAGVKGSVIWSGVDVNERKYEPLPPKPAGIVIARNELRSYDYWKARFDAEHDAKHGGKNVHPGEHYHAERQYKASNYSIHRGLGKPDSAFVAHEASDVSKAPAFMNSAPMRIMQKPSGITRFEVWYGYNLEQGSF